MKELAESVTSSLELYCTWYNTCLLVATLVVLWSTTTVAAVVVQ